ncbi:MAG: carbonic anhydrase [Planctomyces sp.]|nr:carbonic anhydrase [Planctomyces sp.]
MHDLVKGVHQFHNVGRRQHLELFENLKHGQNPEACFITCADSRILPNLITDSEPGQLFTIRNVGNLIPCYGTSNNGEMAAVEYAVVELGIRDLIICGHTGCGAMKALMTPVDPLQRPHVPSVVNWLKHADATAEIVRTHYPNLSGDELIQVTAEENVLVQLEHLKTLPVIAARFPTGDVRLHGWMYKIDTGEVFYFDSEVGQFVKFGDEPRDDSSQKRKAGTRGKS